jgi:hypothetical protein
MLRCDEPRERIMTTTARRPRKRWTYADYCRIPADRLIHEIIDGRHFSHPAPSIRHQRVRGWLMYELMNLLHASDRGTFSVAESICTWGLARSCSPMWS